MILQKTNLNSSFCILKIAQLSGRLFDQSEKWKKLPHPILLNVLFAGHHAKNRGVYQIENTIRLHEILFFISHFG